MAKRKGYAIIPSEILRDKNLSNGAIGLLCKMYNLPKEWKFSIEGLISISQEGKTAITRQLKELKDNGYLIVIKQYPKDTKSKKIEYTYLFRKEDIEAYKQGIGFLGLENQAIENQAIENQAIENQAIENQTLEIQDLENQPQYNTYDKLHKNKLHKDKIHNNTSNEDSSNTNISNRNDIATFLLEGIEEKE